MAVPKLYDFSCLEHYRIRRCFGECYNGRQPDVKLRMHCRHGQQPQTLRDVQASAAQLWSSAADDRGDATAPAPSSSATEPLSLHPYYEPVCVLNKCGSPCSRMLDMPHCCMLLAGEK